MITKNNNEFSEEIDNPQLALIKPKITIKFTIEQLEKQISLFENKVAELKKKKEDCLKL